MTLQIVPLQSERRILVGEELRLQFRLCQSQTGRPLSPMGSLQVLVFDPAEGRQGTCTAHPVSDGVYETTLPAPLAGPCYLFFSCPESRIGYAELPHLIIEASPSSTSVVSRMAPQTSADM